MSISLETESPNVEPGAGSNPAIHPEPDPDAHPGPHEPDEDQPPGPDPSSAPQDDPVNRE